MVQVTQVKLSDFLLYLFQKAVLKCKFFTPRVECKEKNPDAFSINTEFQPERAPAILDLRRIHIVKALCE